MSPSVIKFLIAAAVIWFVWRYFTRLGQASRSGRPDGRSGGRSDGEARGRGQTRRAEREIEDMVKCPKCGSYVPAKGNHDCSAEHKAG
jgi:hypothetical protein